MAAKKHFVDVLGDHEREIHRYLFRMTGNAEDAADVYQETFLRAFRAFPKLPGNANHRAWLFRIAHRQALNLFRSQKVRASLPIEDAGHLGDPERSPDSLSETRQLARTLGDVIRKLTLRQRSALLLKKYEGLSYRAVSEILGCSEETARAQVYQAMKKVRNGLKH